MLYYLIKYIIGPLLLLVFRPVVYGKQNLRVKGKAIFVSNHISLADPILIALCSPRIVHFMAKSELFKNKFANIFLRSCLAFPVNRKSADLTSLKIAIKVLNKEKVFGIFPEGKRSITDDMDEFEKGAAFLAVRTGAPIVPIYIHPWSWRMMHPKILVGRPINTIELVAEANKMILIDVVTNKIADAINALKIELEATDCR